MKEGLVNASKSLLQLVRQEIDEKKETDLEDDVIYAISHSIIEKAADLHFLMRNSRYESVEIISRTMLELFVSLKYILKEDTNRRALSYYYSYKKQMAKKIQGTIDLMREENIMIDLTEKDLMNLEAEIPGATTLEEYKQHYNNLSIQMYSKDTNKDNRKRWYDIDGNLRGFRDLMAEVNMNGAEYEFFYGIGSLDVHGLDIIGKINNSNGNLTIKNNRDVDLVNIKNSFYLIDGITSVVNHYKISNKKTQRHITLMEINYKQLKKLNKAKDL